MHVMITIFPAMIIVVGLGFILHEIAHKIVALKYGFWAEYKLWFEGLVLAIVMAIFLGIVFAAPGAVYIYGGHIRRDEDGKISLAGPLTNIFLALLFLALTKTGFFREIFYLGFAINSFLAFFNLLPIGILDGSKVFRWNFIIWFFTIVFAFVLFLFAIFAISV